MNFLKNIYFRLTAKSPKFFRVIQVISAFAFILSEIPNILFQFGIDFGTIDPTLKVVFITSSIVAFLTSQFAVSDDSHLRDKVNRK